MVFMPHWPYPKGKNTICLGLERTLNILEKLGNPHLALPPTIHVAGTNGKGSTIAFLKSILENAGYSVHRYTSPHLLNFNERIMLNGRDITDPELYRLMEDVRSRTEECDGTFFELTTAAAFYAFSRAKADFLLLETGLGGRLDSTNVIQNPLMTIITPIAFDHMEYLGTTLTSIASEKAGIIKPNSACVISWQYEEAMTQLLKITSEVRSHSYANKKDWDFYANEQGFIFEDFETNQSFQLPIPSLSGIHQIVNAATATAAALQLSNDYNISPNNIRHGLTHTYWPARMENMTKELQKILPPGFELWMDGAHNNAGAEMLAHTISHKWPKMPIYLINGRTGGRDISGFLNHFSNLTKDVYAVKVVSEPSGEEAQNIAAAANGSGFNGIACDSIFDAISKISSHTPGIIIVCGSLYLFADLKAAIGKA